MASAGEGSQNGCYPEFFVAELRTRFEEDCRLNCMPLHCRLDAGFLDLTALFSMRVEIKVPGPLGVAAGAGEAITKLMSSAEADSDCYETCVAG
jgi:hypothetical protein